MHISNRLLRSVTTVFLMLLSAICSTALSADGRFSSGKSAVAIPFELDDNLIYVRVSVNGSRPLSFILDTGAHSIIHARQARSLGLKLKSIGQARGVGANQPDVYLVTEKVSFKLPGVELSLAGSWLFRSTQWSLASMSSTSTKRVGRSRLTGASKQ